MVLKNLKDAVFFIDDRKTCFLLSIIVSSVRSVFRESKTELSGD